MPLIRDSIKSQDKDGATMLKAMKMTKYALAQHVVAVERQAVELRSRLAQERAINAAAGRAVIEYDRRVYAAVPLSHRDELTLRNDDKFVRAFHDQCVGRLATNDMTCEPLDAILPHFRLYRVRYGYDDADGNVIEKIWGLVEIESENAK